MRLWIITDTHLGHAKMPFFCGRPEGFEDRILSGIKESVRPGDVLAHMGDVCFGCDDYWNKALINAAGGCRKWLCLGNHDKKSAAWYMAHGWDFVAESFTIRTHGVRVMFSHIPQRDNGYGLNVHGHFHNNDHRKWEPEIVAVMNNKHFLVAMEHLLYRPILLDRIIKLHEGGAHGCGTGGNEEHGTGTTTTEKV